LWVVIDEIFCVIDDGWLECVYDREMVDILESELILGSDLHISIWEDKLHVDGMVLFSLWWYSEYKFVHILLL